MTNSPGTSTPNSLKSTLPDTDSSPRSIVMGPSGARGLGGAPRYDHRRYYDIFEDDADTGVGSDANHRAMGWGSTLEDRQPPFPPQSFFGSNVEGQSFFVFYHQKGQGVKIVIQAGTRAFLIALAVVVLFLTSPGIRDALEAVVKAISNIMH